MFPHSEICGSKLICSSPQLIAACHVLHRLPMPRHSPYALLRLNYLYVSPRINITVLISLELLCFILCSLKTFLRAFMAKLFVLPFKFRQKNLISILSIFSFSLYFVCHVCHTDSFYRINMQYLIRFSMNFSLTSH